MTSLFIDNEQYIYLDDETDTDKNIALSPDLRDRYHLALLEWEAVQDELAEIYKAQ